MSLGVFNSAAFLTASQLAVAANATVEVRRESDSGLASIFSDRAGTAAITNPSAFADSSGRFTFYVAASPGGFSIEVTSGAESFMLRNVPIGTAQELDADPFWAVPLAAASKSAARVAFGFPVSVDAEIPIGDGTDFISVPVPMGFSLLNGYLAWTVASNVLTVAVKNWAGNDPSAADPVYIAFRDAAPATGLPVIRKLTAATSIAINDTATLGTINSTAFRLWCVAFDDGGTVRLALINCLSGTAPSLNIFPLAGWGIASSTLEDNASDSAAVFYSSGAAVTAKAYATLGYATWEAGLATAGTWSAGPTRAQMFGLGVPLPGQVLQQVRAEISTTATTTSQIPADATIPQNTEGAEFMTIAVTPSSAANALHLGSLLNLGTTLVSWMTSAIFEDAGADAIATGNSFVSTDGAACQLTIDHHRRAASTTQRTYNLRGGGSTAATFRLNGSGAAQFNVGVFRSHLQATELMT